MTVEPSERRAMVTGATRGIGKATALALAAAGWNVAITGRTRSAGEGRDDSDTGEGRALPGSLEETAGLIRESGGTTLELTADLHDRVVLREAVGQVEAAWGGVDLLVNNAVDTGPGSMVGILEITAEQMETKLSANVVAQLVLIQAVLPGMLARGNGVIVDVTSHVATADPPGPLGQGGWGLAYAASKAAFHRIAPLLAVEFSGRGIRAYNVDPGYVETERQKVNAAALGLAGHYSGAPPSVPAAAIAWLAEAPDEIENGQTVRAQKLALTHSLHPDWRVPA
ncbi:MAG TPA: SDR family NAD(P)-dependent oxidoreductase [Acidimicrobiales bacterium]|jgi:NAD(P)-dependent dehydrogenase (short-subunit alcohol dehydrogenase family)|nr:SDR family NAD(P)-dependent oxidoreductase [Acidimicrobiales bacterium]